MKRWHRLVLPFALVSAFGFSGCAESGPSVPAGYTPPGDQAGGPGSEGGASKKKPSMGVSGLTDKPMD